ncbi:MAG TPA: class I SAM-dependent methyltransferase [Flexivirga sp.]|uniref:class I SAM-dependent methyltransferase n=1 Tax=Flexivirga sp. TaxID=1962927 RepID=UPI002BB88ABF|nr:class I SAM-dependent methyltransferase [Flexivirga sp.]HWC21855.1 class I SAM-dependent methyltransferase [Flexivirga sp.]
MSIRSAVGSTLRSTLGGPRTDNLRRREVAVRANLARRLTPQAAPSKSAGAASKATSKAGPGASGKLTRQETIDALGRAGTEGLGAGSKPPNGLKWASPDPFEHTSSGTHKHTLLATMHDLLEPRTYFEIGVDQGQSLTLSSARTIAVDPAYRITRSIQCDVRTFLQTSDDFFATAGNFDHFHGVPVDLAFIDGMHLAEFVFRDFMNIEKHMSPGGVVILDDMLPRNSLEAQRIRRTVSWAGDVYKVHEVLRRHRPDLTLLPINTDPTGSYLIVGLDPTSTVLDEVYEQVLPELSAPDPQKVDTDWVRRTHAYDPKAVMSSPVWAKVRALRDGGASAADYTELWQELRDPR